MKAFSFRRDAATTEPTRLYLSGEITERTDFEALTRALESAPATELDLREVSRVNSSGVREWVLFLSRARALRRRLTLAACPPEFVHQLNMIAGFAQGCSVRSVLAPFACENAKCRAEQLVEVELAGDPVAAVQRPRACGKCGGALRFDDLEEAYFAFALEGS